MMAALIAPIETPATHTGSRSAGAKRLVGAGLVGTKGSAALQDEHFLFGVDGRLRHFRQSSKAMRCNRRRCTSGSLESVTAMMSR